jgi:integrase
MATIQERMSKDGKEKTFRVIIRLKGSPPQSATFDRITDARKWATQTEAAIREGRYFKTSEAKKHTFGEMIDRYLRDVVPTRERHQDKQIALVSWWKEELGPYMVSDVTSSMLAECRDRLLRGTTYRGTKRSNATVVRYMAALSHVYSYAVNEWEWLDTSPLKKVKKPKEPRGRVRFLNDEEREALLTACRESDSPFLFPMVVIAISTGMRHGEIAGLTWKNVDLKRKRIILEKTKNDERRNVPLTGLAYDLILTLSKVKRTDTELLFPGDKPHKPVVNRIAFLNALNKAGIKDFRFHDLRHTAASYLAMNGATLAELADILGHKTLAMVKRYTHLSEGHTSGVVERMNQKIFGG